MKLKTSGIHKQPFKGVPGEKCISKVAKIPAKKVFLHCSKIAF